MTMDDVNRIESEKLLAKLREEQNKVIAEARKAENAKIAEPIEFKEPEEDLQPVGEGHEGPETNAVPTKGKKGKKAE